MGGLDGTAVDRYLDRLGLDPEAIRGADADLETLERIQAAHVEHVPFENLAIVGDPFEDVHGDGVTLDVEHLYEKLVERKRGGFCFELNGLYVPLLDALGFDAHRVRAMVLGDDGDPSLPANHHTVIVSLDRNYVSDPGLGKPQMVCPTPLDGEPTPEDAAGVAWRIIGTDRPDCEYAVQCRTPDQAWLSHYVFDITPRDLSYFEATCEYLATAPESWWTGNVIVRTKTREGWLELRNDTFTHVKNHDRTEREVSPPEWRDLLVREFGLSLPR